MHNISDDKKEEFYLMTTNAIEVTNLTKIYKAGRKSGDVLALDNFSLTVSQGQIFGLLGPNGAGKTTFIKVLLGITHPTIGSASILGQPAREYSIRKKVGYLPENHKYPPYLNAEQILIYFAKLSNINSTELSARIDELLAMVKMSKWKKVKIRKYSKGMMQRLGLALAMIHDPDIIFLDEPTDGVDPLGRKEIRDILMSLKNRGKTVFLNSHLLSEVELISDKVAILHKGKLVREGSVEELTTTKEVFEIKVDKNFSENFIASMEPSSLMNSNETTYTFKLDSVESLNRLLDRIREEEYNILSVIPKKSTLEEMFITLIQDEEKQKV